MSDDDRSVSRSPSREREREKSEGPAAEATEEYKLFIGGISWHMDDRELKDTFRKYGPSDARVMLDRVTSRSRGFGFVHFSNKEDMEEAIENMHNTEIDGRKISVTRAIPQDSIQPGTPAAALGKRERGYDRRYDRDRYPPRYDRYGPRGYDRGPYDRYSDYDRYDRGYGGGGGYDRDYRSSYRSDPYDRYSSEYDRDPYYRSSQDGYDRGYSDRYDPDRRGGYDRYSRERDYGRSRGPYDR